jgi:hypothetical protein
MGTDPEPRVGSQQSMHEPGYLASMCLKNPIGWVESGLHETEHMRRSIPEANQVKGSPMGYPFQNDMRNVTHYTSP